MSCISVYIPNIEVPVYVVIWTPVIGLLFGVMSLARKENGRLMKVGLWGNASLIVLFWLLVYVPPALFAP